MRFVVDDCLNFMEKRIESCSIDCIVTSPPYNLGKNYGKYKDNLLYDDYFNWIDKVAVAFQRVISDDGHLFLNIGYTNKEPWIAFDAVQVLRKYFVLQNNLIWIKHIKIFEDTFGIYKPISSNRFTTPTYEHIFHLTKTGKSLVNRTSISGKYGPKKGVYEKAYTPKAQKTRYENTVKRSVCKKLYKHSDWKIIENNINFKEEVHKYMEEKPFIYNKPKDEGNCWYIPYTPIAKLTKELGITILGNNLLGKNDHPAIFPVELPIRCLKFADYKKNWKVLDPFVGTGSTLVACQKLGIKRSLGIDIDQKYIDFSKKRLKKLAEKY